VLLLLAYRLVRGLFGPLAALARSDLSKDAELLVLRHENQVLRRQLGGSLRWDHADRLWLAALSRLVNRHRWPEVFPVTLATIVRSHRDLVARKWNYTSRGRLGRPSTGTSVKTLIVQMAQENPGGELARLGYAIAASTVWEILHTAGINPAPRRADPTWRNSWPLRLMRSSPVTSWWWKPCCSSGCTCWCSSNMAAEDCTWPG